MTPREYPLRPLVGVGVVVLGPAGFLMIQRGKPPRAGTWSLRSHLTAKLGPWFEAIARQFEAQR